MLHAALQYRLSKSNIYQAETQLEREPEYIPWTSTTGNQGIRDLLRKQVGPSRGKKFLLYTGDNEKLSAI